MRAYFSPPSDLPPRQIRALITQAACHKRAKRREGRKQLIAAALAGIRGSELAGGADASAPTFRQLMKYRHRSANTLEFARALSLYLRGERR
jgi:hypothetical protein